MGPYRPSCVSLWRNLSRNLSVHMFLLLTIYPVWRDAHWFCFHLRLSVFCPPVFFQALPQKACFFYLPDPLWTQSCLPDLFLSSACSYLFVKTAICKSVRLILSVVGILTSECLLLKYSPSLWVCPWKCHIWSSRISFLPWFFLWILCMGGFLFLYDWIGCIQNLLQAEYFKEWFLFAS